MIPIKKLSITCPRNDKDAFILLASSCRETDEPEFHITTPFARWSSKKNKWTGTVDQNKQEFSIIRTNAGIFRSDLTRFQLIGKLKRDIVSKKIEVSVQLHLPGLFRMLLLLVGVFIVSSDFFGDENLAWVMTGLIAILQVLFAILDLSNSEAQIEEAFPSPVSNQKFKDPLHDFN